MSLGYLLGISRFATKAVAAKVVRYFLSDLEVSENANLNAVNQGEENRHNQ